MVLHSDDSMASRDGVVHFLCSQLLFFVSHVSHELQGLTRGLPDVGCVPWVLWAGWMQARERGHIHVTDLVMHAHKFHNEAILLIHFSPRYKKQEVLAALDTNLPPALRAKCIPFLNGFA